MKRWMGLLLACCMLLCGTAVAEETAKLPEVAIEFGEDAIMVTEQAEDSFSLRLYTVGESMMIYLMNMPGEVTAKDMSELMLGDLPEDAVLIENENGIDQRIAFVINDDEHSALVDVASVCVDGCTVCLLTMADGSAYEQTALSEQVTAWLATMTINGEPVISAEPDAE